MDRKKAARLLYNKYALDFEERTRDYIVDGRELFIKNLNGKDVLDLGCGPGRDSLFFKNLGLNPFCIDISPVIIKMCKEKGLDAKIGDFENLEFENNSFDGVWAYTSLLHSPKKKFAGIIGKIGVILREKGIFYLGMKEGDFEGWIKDERYSGMPRFIALYKDEELKEILSKKFNIAHNIRVEFDGKVYLNYLCRKI